MKLKIGNVEIANPCVLAPMAGVTRHAVPTAVQRTGSRASEYGNGQCESDFLS